MRNRWPFVLAVLLVAIPGSSKEKKKQNFPELILRAHYVAVIVDPEAGLSVSGPTENRIAQSDVETALERWGRFKITMETLNADLIFVVRKGGKPLKETVGGGRRSDRPVILNPGGNDDIDVGVRVGTPPPVGGTDASRSDGPTMRTEVGPTEDILSIYRAGDDNPVDTIPLWRYAARNGLQHPSVPAIEKLRKAIEEAEKARP